MSFSYFRSIRFRLTAWYAALLAIFLIAFSAMTFGVVVSIMQERRVILGQESVRLDLTSPSGEQITIVVPQHMLGQRLRTVGCPLGVRRPDRRCAPITRPVDPAQSGGIAEAPIEPVRIPAGMVHSAEVVRAGFDEETQEEIVHAFLRYLLAMVPALIALSLLGGGLIAHYALAPIGAITRAARRIRAGRLSERIRLQGADDELKELADTFDDMIDELARLLERERRFASDASHELQTPLAVIRTTAEVALTDPALGKEDRNAFDAIIEGTERMSRIVDDLLLLASYEQRPATPVAVPLRPLVAGVIDHLRPLAELRGIALTLVPGKAVTVRTNRDRLERAILSIVENALKYTKEGSVVVSVRTEDGISEIAVQDTGPGIAAEHLAHLFERFYRVDRGRGRVAGGIGLGLSIADAAITSLGGSIRVTSTVGKGSTFTIELPST